MKLYSKVQNKKGVSASSSKTCMSAATKSSSTVSPSAAASMASSTAGHQKTSAAITVITADQEAAVSKNETHAAVTDTADTAADGDSDEAVNNKVCGVR